MSLQKTCRVVLVIAGLAAVIACGGSSGITTSDPGFDGGLPALESASFDASSRDSVLPPALDLVLGREQLAAGLYPAVIDVLQAERPFTEVVLAEVRHVATLQNLYEKRELSPPDPPDPVEIAAIAQGFADIPEACAYALDLENDMAAEYSALLATALPGDVARVLEHLVSAIGESHVPAFEMCAAS